MQLATYTGRGINLDALIQQRTPAAARASARTQWVHLTGSRFCPACLAQDGIWRLAWRLPWTACCLTHRIVLAHRCPACGHRQ